MPFKYVDDKPSKFKYVDEPAQQQPDRLGTAYRDALETTGLIGGGAVGMFGIEGGPEVPVIGAGLGRALGTQGANILDRLRGVDHKTLPQQFKDVGQSAQSGVLAELAGQGIAKPIEAAVGGAARMVPRILRATADIPEKATEFLLKEGVLPPGSPEAIKGAVQDVIGNLKSGVKEAGDVIQAAKEKLGIYKPLQDRVDELPFRAKKVPLQKIVDSYNDLKGASQSMDGLSERQLLAMRQQGKLTQDQFTQAIGKLQDVVKSRGLAPADRIRELVHLRQAIDDHVNISMADLKPIPSEAGGTLRMMAKDVNQMLDAIPEAAELRQGDKAYARAKLAYDKMQKAMATPGKAEEFLMSAFQGKKPTDKEDLMNLLALEKTSGKPVIQNLFREFSGREFSKGLATDKLRTTLAGLSLFALRSFGLPAGVTLPIALASQSPKIMSKLIPDALMAGESMARPVSAAAVSLLRSRRKEQNSGE